MTDKIKSIIDAVTDAVFSYRPKEKGKQAKKLKQKAKKDDRQSSI